LAGGTVSGTTLSGGGAEVVSSGGVVSGTVTFVSGGTLFVNDGLNFGGTLVGFNSATDILDLVNVPYLGSATVLSYTSTGTQSGTDIGTLSVINSGGVVANIALLGNYIAGSADFIATTSAGYAGTIITDPPIAVATDQQGFLTQPNHG
jgi:autotransporter passenger strand-loop-strand repeat protein